MNDLMFDTKRIKAYQGYLTDENLLLKSSSGGVTRELSNAIISRGGVVFGVRYSKDYYRAEYCIIENIEDIDSIIGSKYIYSDKKIHYDGQIISVYNAVQNELEKKKLVLFFGLGCDVAALKKYISDKNTDISNLFLVDLICQGPTFPEVQESYLKRLEDRFSSSVSDFTVRFKLYGWASPPYIRVVFKNGREYIESLYGSDFGFALSNYSRNSCYQCQFKGEGHQSDITIGDFWGIKKEDDGFNKNGVSLMLMITKKAEELLDLIDGERFALRNADAQIAINNNPMYYSCRKKYKNIDRLKENIGKRGLHYAVIKEMGGPKYYYYRLRRLIGKWLRSLSNT